jgi:zinc and cadmium transporter
VHLLFTAIGLSVLGSFGSLALAALLLAVPEHARKRLVPWLVSYAVGTLLGVALLDLMPEVLDDLSPRATFATLLVGIIVFFILEKLVLWRHCHTDDCEVHGRPAALVLIGHGFHSFVDGALIAASVQISVPLGVSIAVAVASHEIPQQVGDFAILLHAGYSRGRALSLSVLSAAGAVVGTIVAFVAFSHTPHVLPFALAVAAASFLYIAMSDLIPDLHSGRIDASAFRQVILVAAGIVTALAVRHQGTGP